MLPSLVSAELQDEIHRFLHSAFPVATPWFQRARDGGSSPHAVIDSLVAEPGALFKGPWLDIRLPFRLAEAGSIPLRHVQIPYTPYQHQLKAFERLCGDAPQSTLVATGTGSGKTECFMLPLLDDALHRREQGIKAIVIYPMNALATDQARRFAGEVAKLDTRITVGLFVGSESESQTTMGPENVITCRRTLHQNPPDILLTNFKMLDFLLIRPKDRALWRFNSPGMLRYLVVDELHTFDGAQGTDLACLVRRLRDRLEVGPELVCVGTSATIGAGASDALLDYARTVFATELGRDGIILEDRLSPEEYLSRGGEGEVKIFHWPDASDPRLDAAGYERAEDYLFEQVRLWFPDEPLHQISQLQSGSERSRAEISVRLGEWLHQHEAFHSLIRACHTLSNMDEMAQQWAERYGLGSREQVKRLLASLVSLVAAARLWRQPDHEEPAKWTQPFLYVRQQLWLRELRRLVCSVPKGDDPARLVFADDLQNTEKPLHLPLLHCRECNLAAWGAVKRKSDSHINADLQGFYQAWFDASPSAMLMIPLTGEQQVEGAVMMLCPSCLRLQSESPSGECCECQHQGLRRVGVPNITRSAQRGGENCVVSHHDCPECGARDSLAIMGYRAATLASVMTGRLFHTPFNDDHKLIAFSDSVQDAAHRAGYIESNTWREVMRRAMAWWLKDKRVDLPLKEMAAQFPAYWRGISGSDKKFCGLFLPPNLAWHQDYRELTKTGLLPDKSELPSYIERRLHWEVIAEFGRRSRIGRSLERTGVAAVAWNPFALNKTIDGISAVLREEIAPLRDQDDAVFRHFVLGLMQHLRSVGAIYDSVLDGYLEGKGNEFIINKFLKWMPGFGRSQRPPAAATLTQVARNLEALTHKSRDTWAMSWLKKVLGEDHVFIAAEAREFFSRLMDGLSRAGWLTEKNAGEETLWLLDPAKLRITTRTSTVECGSCRHRLSVAADEVAAYEGMYCMRSACHGRYALAPELSAPPYQRQSEPRRLVAAEHTGLLEREQREATERSFMRGREPWDANVLSATPTLEMGIDIGELSSVLLCSVPPAQANYLQRIGRAGRRDGNALAITIANGQNHDLYFYEDPMEMMAGDVATPGVFLKATAVLERQLLAYCFDTWNASGVDESAIPDKLGKMLDAVQESYLDQFPYSLLDYIKGNKSLLLDGFFALFPDLDLEAREYLERFLVQSGDKCLEGRLVNRLQDLVKERQSLTKRVDQLKRELEQLKKQPADELIEEQIGQVTRERNALLSILAHIRGQRVLNFFTDEGLLPNYAFPEEGVSLRSVVLRRRSAQERQEGEGLAKDAYVFQRPAQAALSELAPENKFYAISHKMEIEQVDLQLSQVEEWRFCDRCSHSENVDTGDRHSACPKCGSAQWADAGQKHTVLKLRQVYATVDDRRDRIGDDSEQREPVFYNREMLVEIPDEGHEKAYKIDSPDLPFGFEYLQKADFREINFGPKGGESHNFSVAGREMPRQGFKLCRECGKVQKARYRKHERPHAWTCRFNKDETQATEADFLDSLYLYRELTSEAVRILLPLSEVAYSDQKLHSFIAALNLGLRAYFRGDVHHLEVTDMRTPGTMESGERVYLVIYDRIPGGTGYLKELMSDPDKLRQVLVAAKSALDGCGCVDHEDKDGCYRCIYAYRHSRNMTTISRSVASELLGSILNQWDKLKEVESIADISTNVLIESKLEQRFVDALGALPGGRMAPTLVNGKTGSLLTITGADGQVSSWSLEHQVKVGPQDGAPVMTEIDVLLRPAREEDARKYRPIAVYLDGLQYHHDIVGDDVRKRSGLLLSERFWVFSLNWDDLPEPGKPEKPLDIDILRADGVEPGMTAVWDKLAASLGWAGAAKQKANASLGSFRRLERILRDPQRVLAEDPQWSLFRGVTLLHPRSVTDTALRHKVDYELQENAPQWVRERLAVSEQGRVLGGMMDAFGNSPGGMEVTATLPGAAMKTVGEETLLSGMMLHLCFDDRNTQLTDDFKSNWRAFWHAANQLQFLRGFSMSTRSTVADGSLDSVWRSWEALRQTGGERDQVVGQWSDVFELSLIPEDQLHALIALGLPEPQVGLDLTADNGEVLVSGEVVELCWVDQKVVIVEELISVPAGWIAVEAGGDLISRIEQLKQDGVW
ncbi:MULTISPECIES: DEAD/DEAH box helicase [unclassified Microbulbifer]|uniref:DEAD/DEAH box helicase n=1 Tax=unclassified Microbulbifer TaxID=2619833 RepID=UPI0027E4DD7F|nr:MULTISPECIES: DEAD/DEAH box helicase [unclassified Microbulbifer]